MRYLEIDTGDPTGDERLPWWIEVWIELLKLIVPAANPDLEDYYGRTKIWWLEIDDHGLPQREIGVNNDGKAIVLGPVGNNFGFLIDSSDDWSESGDDSLQAAENFDSEWNALWPKFKHLEERKNLGSSNR